MRASPCTIGRSVSSSPHIGLVGTLGDYAPGTNYTETFPKMDDPDATNWPGCTFLTSAMPASNQTVKHSFDTTAYYVLRAIQPWCIVALSNATDISHTGCESPGYFGTIKGTNDVILELLLTEDVTEEDLPVGVVTWTGGQEVPGYQLRRKVSRSTAAHYAVSAECNGVACSANVYVVWCNATGFRPVGTGTTWVTNDYHFADNEPKGGYGYYPPNGVGPEPTDTDSGNAQNWCEIQFTVEPNQLIQDGVDDAFNTEMVQFDVMRDKKRTHWFRLAGATNYVERALPDDPPDQKTNWYSDDFYRTFPSEYIVDEDNDPWHTNRLGHLYANDYPGFPEDWYEQHPTGFYWDELTETWGYLWVPGDPVEVGGVYKFNFREWIRCMFTAEYIYTNDVDHRLTMSQAASQGVLASDAFLWHSFSGVVSNETGWCRSTTNVSENRIAINNVFWGTEP